MGLFTRDFIQSLVQFTNKYINDLELGLIHSYIKIVKRYFCGLRFPLQQSQQLQHLIFFPSETDRFAVKL